MLGIIASGQLHAEWLVVPLRGTDFPVYDGTNTSVPAFSQKEAFGCYDSRDWLVTQHHQFIPRDITSLVPAKAAASSSLLPFAARGFTTDAALSRFFIWSENTAVLLGTNEFNKQALALTNIQTAAFHPGRSLLGIITESELILASLPGLNINLRLSVRVDQPILNFVGRDSLTIHNHFGQSVHCEIDQGTCQRFSYPTEDYSSPHKSWFYSLVMVIDDRFLVYWHNVGRRYIHDLQSGELLHATPNTKSFQHYAVVGVLEPKQDAPTHFKKIAKIYNQKTTIYQLKRQFMEERTDKVGLAGKLKDHRFPDPWLDLDSPFLRVAPRSLYWLQPTIEDDHEYVFEMRSREQIVDAAISQIPKRVAAVTRSSLLIWDIDLLPDEHRCVTPSRTAR